MRRLIALLVSRWQRLRRLPHQDAEMADEMRFHLEMEAGRLQREHRLDDVEAHRRAAVAFGGVEKYRAAGRDAVGLTSPRGVSTDVKLGLRILVKYPGLTLAGGLALAVAVGVGAAWFDLSGDLFRPRMPFAGGDRLVEIEMRNSATVEDERRVLHDFLVWQRELTTVEDLGVYRAVQRNLVLGDARPEPIEVAELTASALRLPQVPPLLGRPLVEADDDPGAPPVAVLGFDLWQTRFGASEDVIGRTLQLGKTAMTIVGVMPRGFAFPVNHRLWVPLQLRRSGYAPLEGAPVRIVGRLKNGVTQEQSFAEVTTLAEREAAASPATHLHLRPRVLAYGGESPGDRSMTEFIIRHLPVLLVLLVACVNVGTLIYARTVTREPEIAMRYALGANRGRIVMQLFIEALVLGSIAAAVGLAVANVLVEWGLATFYAGLPGGMPFWIVPGLKLRTVLYALGLTIAAAAILGILPALKLTTTEVQAQLKNLGVGGSTLRFGKIWSAAMILQVTLTVICLPPAMGISQETLRDYVIRGRFPAERYLAARLELDREISPARGEESDAAFALRLDQSYAELERRLLQEPGVVSVTFADRLPGMSPRVRRGEAESATGSTIEIPNLWSADVGATFFQAFDIPIVAGRDFDATDRRPNARTVLVNEAFGRQYTPGSSPVGHRVRYASGSADAPEPWLEIVGVVRDIGMTPTDLGEAPYVFHPTTPSTVQPLVIGVKTAGDPALVAARMRPVAAAVEPGLRLDELRSLKDLVWRVDVPQLVAGAAIAGIVTLGLFLSAAGIFALMSVSVTRRTREIALRSALGANRAHLFANILSRALALVGSGIAAGNAVLVLVIRLSTDLAWADITMPLLTTSALMLSVGLLACLVPARRALRIQPVDALKLA